jgi:hypothetical protein
MLKGAKMLKTPKKSNHRNEYRCCIELNQNGKYCVRISAHFARRGWELPVYFLVSKFDRAFLKLEQALQFLQREEDRLWFWGVDRSDDPNVAAEMLRESGLQLDRRAEFPRRNERLMVSPERQVPGFMLQPMRRNLAESVEVSR